MRIDEKEREQMILNAAAELLLRHGYDKTTMSDVSEAVNLNRRLVYLLFPSKEELIEALLLREMNAYAEAWSKHLDTDPLGDTVASLFRSMLYATRQFPFMAAIHTRDKHLFGKYLHKPDNLFTRI